MYHHLTAAIFLILISLALNDVAIGLGSWCGMLPVPRSSLKE